MIAMTTKSSIKVKPGRHDNPTALGFVSERDKALTPTASVDFTTATPLALFDHDRLQLGGAETRKHRTTKKNEPSSGTAFKTYFI